MAERQMVQIPAEQVQKLAELEDIRLDLKGYPLSRKVHILLQEKLADLFLSKKPQRQLKGKWYEYVRECFPVHVISLVAIGVVNYTEEMLGKPFHKILIASQADKAWWCNAIEDMYEVGEYLLEKLNDKKALADHCQKIEMLYEEVKTQCDKIRKENLKRLSKKELKSYYNDLYVNLQKYHGLSWDIDAFDVVLEEKIKERFKELFIEKRGKFSATQYNEDYNVLGTPSELSYVSQEQIAISEVAQRVRQSPKLEKIFTLSAAEIQKRIKNTDLQAEIDRLEEKYWWTLLGWLNRSEKSTITFIDDIKKILRETKDIKVEITRIREFPKEMGKRKEQLAKQYQFSADLNFYLMLMDRFMKYHDYRKEIQMKGTAAMNYLLFELSRRSGVKYDDLVWCFPFEIQDFMNTNHIDLSKIEKRKEAYFILVTKQGVEELTGEQAIRRRNEELDTDLGEVNDFKGVIASTGKVTGVAKVCYSAQDANQKMKQGDVLIASMTLPNYVSAMKKAAAIVTDEGGVTCHAAIVSRELKIPSIVGTQVATKVIQDGDLIEVNANHGTVRILKRK